MRRLLLTGAALFLATSAHAYCIRPTDGGFYNPNCITQAQADALAQYSQQRANSVVVITYSDGGSGDGSNSERAATQTVTRSYALGSEPRKGKPGTQSVPNGLREVNRTEREQALASKSTLTGPAVRTDPKTGAKSLVSVNITYSNGRSSERSSTSGPGQQR